MKQPNEMTNEELDEALAIEVMGWHIFGYEWHELGGKYVMDVNDWHPTTDLNQTWECLEKFKGYEILKSCYRKNYSVRVWEEFGLVNRCAGTVVSDNLPRALCEAVLMAKRGEK